MAVSATLVSAAEYLRLEREAETKHEWYGGKIYEMPGVGKEHGRIQSNLGRMANSSVADTDCEFSLRTSEFKPESFPSILKSPLTLHQTQVTFTGPQLERRV